MVHWVHSKQQSGRCLTIRSTGHFAAVGLWPSFHSWPKPNLRKTPVSSNVSHQNVMSVHSPVTLKSCLQKHMRASLSKSTANTYRKLRSMGFSTCQSKKYFEPSAEQGTASLRKNKSNALIQRNSGWFEPHPGEQKAKTHGRH